MIASPLRELAKRFSKGELPAESYRSQRHEYLEEILQGKTKLSYRDTLSKEQIAISSPQLAFDPTDWRSYTDFSDRRVQIGAVGLLVLLTGAYFALREPPPPPPAPVEVRVMDPAGIDLLQILLAEEFWSEQQLRTFAADWQALTDAQRDDARSNPGYRSFRTRLRQMIQDQESLANLGDDQAAAFALFLGEIRDSVEGA